jgi:hypothetical protein
VKGSEMEKAGTPIIDCQGMHDASVKPEIKTLKYLNFLSRYLNKTMLSNYAEQCFSVPITIVIRMQPARQPFSQKLLSISKIRKLLPKWR